MSTLHKRGVTTKKKRGIAHNQFCPVCDRQRDYNVLTLDGLDRFRGVGHVAVVTPIL